MRISSIGLIAAAGVALSGCVYGGYGSGIGVGIGYGNGYGYSPYGGYGYNPYYDPYFSYGSRYSYGYNPYGYSRYHSPYGGGWYNGYYYPGSGYWVYDRDRNRRQISDAERAYWRQRLASGVANRIRERRGDNVTTTTNTVQRQQVSSSPTRSTVDRSERRERSRERTRARIENRRTERAQRRGD